MNRFKHSHTTRYPGKLGRGTDHLHAPQSLSTHEVPVSVTVYCRTNYPRNSVTEGRDFWNSGLKRLEDIVCDLAVCMSQESEHSWVLWLWVPHRQQSSVGRACFLVLLPLKPQHPPPSALALWSAGLVFWLSLSQAPASIPRHTDLSPGHSMAACFVRAHKQEEPEGKSLGKMEAPVICLLSLVESLDPAHSPAITQTCGYQEAAFKPFRSTAPPSGRCPTRHHSAGQDVTCLGSPGHIRLEMDTWPKPGQ